MLVREMIWIVVNHVQVETRKFPLGQNDRSGRGQGLIRFADLWSA